LTGQSAVVESGDGIIGSALSPFRVDIASGSKITSRAANGIWMEEVSGDMEIGQIYSPTIINLRSNTGNIVDFEEDLIMDVKGHEVALFAAGTIGEQVVTGNTQLTDAEILLKKQRALDVASVSYDNSTFEVSSSSGGAWLYGPLGQSIRMTGSDLAGELDVATGALLKAQGDFQTDGNDITLRSYENLQLDGDGGITTNGALLRVVSGETLSMNGVISTSGGSIYTQSGDNTTIVNGARISTQGGNFTAYADGLLNQNITIEDNATINTASGAIRMSASDTIYVTGLSSTSNAGCAAGQTGCAVTLLATNIQDNGDSFDDIELNGNGDIRLQAHQYINLNKIDYNGSNPLQLDIAGKNDDARGVAAILGVDAEAGLNISRLVMNSASIYAPKTSVLPGMPAFSVDDGRIRDNFFMDIGGEQGDEFLGRVGRLEDNQFEPDSWLLAADASSGYFGTAALQPSVREDDFRCSGAPSYLGDANAILSFSFFFQRPGASCDALLVYYNPRFELASSKRTVNEEVLTVLADLNRNTGVIAASALVPSITSGSGFVLNTPASVALSSRSLDISGERVELAGEQILLNNRPVASGRILLGDALVNGIIDEGSVGFINLGLDELADIQDVDQLIDDPDNQLNQDEQPEDSANIQTIKAIPAAQLDQNIGIGVVPASLSVVENAEILSSAF